MVDQVSNPSMFVNNEPIGYAVNSLEHDIGIGEAQVNIEVIGNGQIAINTANNIDTAKGRVKFEKDSVPEAMELMRQYRANGSTNVILLVSTATSSSYAYQNMTLINNPTAVLTPDGKAEFIFEGLPSIF